MSRQKLIRFSDNKENPQLIEPGKPIYETIKGNWHQTYFANENPITLELACGRGEYTTGLAPLFPARNFVGVDVKGDRLWKGCEVARSQNLTNVAFLRAQIQQLDSLFAPGEVAELWLVFPDPRPKGRDERRRLTHPRFLEMYRRITAPGSLVHLKTDNVGLFEYTLDVLREFPVRDVRFTRDLYHSELHIHHFGIKTRYESIFAGEGLPVHYLQFRFQ